jgi:PTS system nitrogen regulatory IIA component
VLEELAELLAANHSGRKKRCSTCFWNGKNQHHGDRRGVAIPHGKLAGVDRVVGAFARSPKGVDFASLDGGPTHLFFALIAPENAAADHLKALARISRLLKDEAFRRRLMAGETAEELFTIIAEEDEKF